MNSLFLRAAELHKKEQQNFNYSNDFLAFVVDMHKRMYAQDFIIKPFHYELCSLLEKVANRKIAENLIIINMPPRFSKTQILVYYVMWCFCMNPSAKFIYVAYSIDLSRNASNDIKFGLKTFFHDKIQFTKKGDGWWKTTAQGTFLATTPSGKATGFGCGDFFGTSHSGDLIFDDPQKLSDIFYQKKRENVNRSYSETFWSRRNHKGLIPTIVAQQRGHEEDFTGYLLSQDRYPKIRLKITALDENGNSNFPETLPVKDILDFKILNEYAFHAQMQQDPQKLTGNFFDIEQIGTISLEEFNKIKHDVRFYVRSWDLAGVSKNKTRGEKMLDRDWTRGIRIAVLQDLYIVIDLKSVRGLVSQNDALIDDVAEEDSYGTYHIFPLDPATGGEHYAHFIKNLPNLIGKETDFIRQDTDKVIRSKPTQKLVRQGKFLLLSESDSQKNELITWQAEFLEEMASFPFGKHDDIVDALTQSIIYVQDKHSEANFEAHASIGEIFGR